MSPSDAREADGALLREVVRASGPLGGELAERLGGLSGIVVIGETWAREADVVVAEWPAERAAVRENDAVHWVGRSQEAAAPPPGQSFVLAAAPDGQWRAALHAVAAGLSVRPRPSGAAVRGVESETPDVEPLTPREHDVLDLLALGLPNRAIAERLGISEHTVKFHLAALFGKLQVTTRTEAIRRALQEGLVTL